MARTMIWGAFLLLLASCATTEDPRQGGGCSVIIQKLMRNALPNAAPPCRAFRPYSATKRNAHDNSKWNWP